MHPQTLRYYERLGLIEPSRSSGKIRLYSARDVDRLKQIHGYVNDLGVNLAGVEIVLNLTERMSEMEAEINRLKTELAAYRSAPSTCLSPSWRSGTASRPASSGSRGSTSKRSTRRWPRSGEPSG